MFIDQQLFTHKNCCESTFYEKAFLILSNPKQSKNDLIIAEIMANELLYIYLEKELNLLKPCDIENYHEQSLKWTGSKVALVELIYALYSSRMINNGNVDIKELVTIFERLFDYNIGSPYQAFSEIKARRQDPTKFLDQLKDALLKRIEEE